MTDTLTVIGVIGTEPRSIDTANGTAMTSFRLASAQRRYDRGEQRWVDVSTNWYTVNAFNGLAGNALGSLARGDRVIVTGRLAVRSWEAGGKSGTDVTVNAEGIGHDLAWGTTSFSKTVGRSAAPAPSTGPEAVGWSAEAPPSAPSEALSEWGASPSGRAPTMPSPEWGEREASLESVDTPL
ncbi:MULTISPECIES: single-stranded DNA-binding protein [unclassified Rathayibacter]|uniref:single-stranded DNA-binding protein n=1 Tax=unclassified Rathayibacter TaxID=2609250 RepID=UPI001889CF72|nr:MULTISPECIES: single-stranded DNA-binding protein [unclassified Rathayibacter]MBF4462219.1 single-stranded DNA-binding protein [Rathayibacter sp. VKM Ac-2879]MBF4503738.1 single-stranded DNA-binding protein [Rathayibacter sp. VKM Ac-2878]